MGKPVGTWKPGEIAAGKLLWVLNGKLRNFLFAHVQI